MHFRIYFSLRSVQFDGSRDVVDDFAFYTRTVLVPVFCLPKHIYLSAT